MGDSCGLLCGMAKQTILQFPSRAQGMKGGHFPHLHFPSLLLLHTAGHYNLPAVQSVYRAFWMKGVI